MSLMRILKVCKIEKVYNKINSLGATNRNAIIIIATATRARDY